MMMKKIHEEKESDEEIAALQLAIFRAKLSQKLEANEENEEN
jgi:hypothetical protein